MYRPLLSSKICLLPCFRKPNKTVDPCFIPVLGVRFRHVQLAGQAGCLPTRPCCTESSAGEWRLSEVSNAWDICSCSKCQSVLGGTVTSPYVIKLIIATDSDWKRLFARLNCKQ